MGRKKLLFVCIGNTCRSPMAESIMKHWIDEYNLDWKVDSAALKPWNIGRKPDDRCRKVLTENGLTTKHVARLITVMDFYKNDYILGMDENNIRDLKALIKGPNLDGIAKIELLGSYIYRAEDQIIRDPYFSNGLTGFRCAFDQITESCQNFIVEHALIPAKMENYENV